MALKISKRCNRCGHKMRNDGTAENPKWVCNYQSCIKYVPPAGETVTEAEVDKEEE